MTSPHAHTPTRLPALHRVILWPTYSMPLLPPSTLTFTQAEIAALFEQSVQQFMLKGNSIGDSADFEYAQALFSTFLGYAREITIAAAFTGDVGGKALDDNKNEISPTLDLSPSPPESTIAPRASISGDFLSIGRILSTKNLVQLYLKP